jgi:hypothetical protein
MNKEQILNIVSQYTQEIVKAKTFGDFDKLENEITNKLYQLFILHEVNNKDSRITLGYEEWMGTQLKNGNCLGGKYEHVLGFWISERELLQKYRLYRNNI